MTTTKEFENQKVSENENQNKISKNDDSDPADLDDGNNDNVEKFLFNEYENSDKEDNDDEIDNVIDFTDAKNDQNIYNYDIDEDWESEEFWEPSFALRSGIKPESVPNKIPRKDLTLADKISLLDQIKNQPPHTSHRQLSKITGVPKSTIARVIQKQDKLREEWALCKGPQGATQKRKREGKNPDVEEALNQWFSVVTRRGMRVSGPMLKTKSEALAKKLGHKDFKATDGWLSRWKTRHDIKLKKIQHDKDFISIGNMMSNSATVSADHWISVKFPSLLQKFCEDDIYNVSETGLFYRVTPDGSLHYKRSVLSESKHALDSVTILCCSNMSGNDKRKPIVIGKNARPQCFEGLRMDSLPIIYYANKNAWMTSKIFTKWLMSWDLELQQESRKILLLLCKSVVHPYLSCLKNIHLEFLPIDSSTLIQPMDMGIIKNFKITYRKKIINYIFELLHDSVLTPNSIAKEISKKINLLQAIQFIADSWREVNETTIRNCFIYCGFTNLDSKIIDNINSNNEAFVMLQHVKNYQEFICIDNGLQCYNESENWEDILIEQISKKRQELLTEDNNEHETSEYKPVTNQDARKYIAGLRQYFMQEGNENSPLSALNVCADFVQLQSFQYFFNKTCIK